MLRTLLLLSLLACLTVSKAQIEKSDHFNLLPQGDSIKKWNLHFQTTYVYQRKPGFQTPYDGINSLKGVAEHQNSLTATVYAGFKLFKNTSFYINPELAGGSGLSGALGMAGSSNGETFRVGNPAPTLYLARAYISHTIPLSKKTTWEQDDANMLGGFYSDEFLTFMVGKYSLGDIFDNNDFANSPRTQFMNWALMNNGAWDYAANVRGYTYSISAELQKKKTNYKIAFAALPNVANGASLNTHFSKSNAINIEISRAIKIANKEGMIRVLGYRNMAGMGNYSLATEAHDSTLLNTRLAGRKKSGIGLNWQQQVTKNTGFFMRAGWNDGKNETWAFTEIDRTATMGFLFDGKGWRRGTDQMGIAGILNGISPEHRKFLAAGGRGFMLGDGKLNYAPETVFEFFYNLKPSSQPLWFSFDYQFAINPGYNKDRGPANIFSVRLHVEL